MVALPWWLGKCQLGPGPSARPCLGFPTPQSSEGGCWGREPVRTPSLHRCLILVVFFPLADAEQSSSPRTGIGSDQEDSKPITLGESRAQGAALHRLWGCWGALRLYHKTVWSRRGASVLSYPPSTELPTLFPHRFHRLPGKLRHLRGVQRHRAHPGVPK